MSLFDDDTQPTEPTTAGAVEFQTAHREAFEAAGLDVRSRFVDLAEPPVRMHVLETNGPDTGPPVVFVHGTAWFAAYFAPLWTSLKGIRLLGIDRPGWGQTDDFRYTARTYRRTARDVLSGVLDELGIDRVDLVGNSTGGFWSLAFALARPERVRRLCLLGGVVAFPGTRTPLPVRWLATPGLDRLLTGRSPPSEASAVRHLGGVGDGAAVRRFPALVRAKIAQDRRPRSTAVELSELRSLSSAGGWRSAVRLRQLRGLRCPSTFVWGDRDWFGRPGAVRDIVESMPNADLVRVNAGHAPWLDRPSTCAELLDEWHA